MHGRIGRSTEITLQVSCSACSGTFNVIFDSAGYLIQNWGGMSSLYHEVHLLASLPLERHGNPGYERAKASAIPQLLEDELYQQPIQWQLSKCGATRCRFTGDGRPGAASSSV
jgi:hypothetical protein